MQNRNFKFQGARAYDRNAFFILITDICDILRPITDDGAVCTHNYIQKSISSVLNQGDAAAQPISPNRGREGSDRVVPGLVPSPEEVVPSPAAS